MRWMRREVLKSGLAAAAATAGGRALASNLLPGDSSAPDQAAPQASPFTQRGYYITFMRAPLYTFETWKKIFDDIQQDGGNLVILWMAGSFRSKKFPITWQYNLEHNNIKHDFAGELIEYGHSLGMKVLLCLTPYGYDGTNQYALEHPELKAITADGNYTRMFGLGAWGFNLNPFRKEAETFMEEYTREMLAFYPNADGVLFESSDYAISACGSCPETYYQKEFQFVRRMSEEIWARKPDATVAVYPHYFSGTEVPGMKVKAEREYFDPRWTLFFTPHSAYLDPALVRQAKSSIYWDPSPTFGRPALIKAAAQKARAAGVTGFVPSFEPWNFRYSGPDQGATVLVGTRSTPFGFGWLQPGELPSRTLLMRLDRLAYREFSKNPKLPMERFSAIANQELFGGKASPALMDDLFFFEESFFLDRMWDSTCAIASPAYVRDRIERSELGPARLTEYRDRRRRIATIAERYKSASDPSTAELARNAAWVIERWQTSPDHVVVDNHLR